MSATEPYQNLGSKTRGRAPAEFTILHLTTSGLGEGAGGSKTRGRAPVEFTILHLTTSGLGEGAVILAVSVYHRGCNHQFYIEQPDVQLEEGAAKIHRASGFLQRYNAARREGSLVKLQDALQCEKLLLLPQGANFLKKFLPTLASSSNTLDLRRLVDLGLCELPPVAIQYQEREVVTHWVKTVEKLCQTTK